MLESIYVGMTGLLGYSRGLRVIANNTANINTPGFKSSSLQFADMFYTGSNLGGGIADQNSSQVGFGLNTTGTALSFKQGELRQTGNDLDAAIDGQGLFVVRNDEGEISYTRDGQFKFNADGVLVTTGNGYKVMGLDDAGQFVEITLDGQKNHPGTPTTLVKVGGGLSTNAAADSVLPNVKLIDGAGSEHTVSVKFHHVGTKLTDPWQVDVMEGTDSVGSGQLQFIDGKLQPGATSFSFNYGPGGQTPVALTFDFTDVTAQAGGSQSSLTLTPPNGVGPGSLTGTTFDASGALTLKYSNAQTRKGISLAVARFDSPDAIASAGGNQFKVVDPHAWHIGKAGDGAFGKVRAGVVEISNVDLSQEFSDLVVMQRGYQASSQVISTANDMLQELFSMKSK